MSDYFDHVERGLRESVSRRAHLPWYVRLLSPRPRALAVAVVVLVGGGTALAANLIRTGSPVGAEVPAISSVGEGAVVPGSVKLLGLRVRDPGGGPPWGLRILRTTRGLLCVQPGRVVEGRIGVIGEDGAFGDDGAFHPFSSTFLSGTGCGTEDARGDAFLNEEINGLPASALEDRDSHTKAGCYQPHRDSQQCPSSALRDVYFGLLGPDASGIAYATSGGATATEATAGSDGGYLVVLPYVHRRCVPTSEPFCYSSQPGTLLISGPDLRSSPAIRQIAYRNGSSCQLPALRETAAIDRLRPRHEPVHPSPGCPPVGYVPLPGAKLNVTPAQLASAVSVRAAPAKHYCEQRENTIPCEKGVPRGYRRIDLSRGPRELLVVVHFTARVAVTNFDSHYEINMTDPSDPSNPRCPSAGAGTFGPTQRNLAAGQRVRYTTFVNAECPGVTRVSVDFVSVNGPSGDMPVPGLPGQSAEIPVGRANFRIP